MTTLRTATVAALLALVTTACATGDRTVERPEPREPAASGAGGGNGGGGGGGGGGY